MKQKYFAWKIQEYIQRGSYKQTNKLNKKNYEVYFFKQKEKRKAGKKEEGRKGGRKEDRKKGRKIIYRKDYL